MTPAEHPDAAALDERDGLRSFRDRFTPTAGGLIYLDGNSLGRLPIGTPERMAEIVSEWGERLIRGWDEGWMELPIRYVLEGLAQSRGLTIRWIETAADAGPLASDVGGLVGPETALVALSHVAYRSAFRLDMDAITAVAHEAGALVLWDLSHSAGVAPVDLDGSGADLATGCTYKYLNGGPGAPAFLYVRAEHQPVLRQPIWGWLGRRDPFVMAQGYEPAAGIGSFLSGTPPVLALTAVAAGLDLVCEAGIAALRAKAVALGEFVIARHDEWLAPLGVSLGSPRRSAERGGHVALVHPQAAELCRALVELGVITDFRSPDIIRIGLSPLTTSFADAERGLTSLRGLISG